MNRILFPIAGTALLALAAMPVLAANDSAVEPTAWDQKIDQLFVEIDGNGDGSIDATEAETNKALAKAFPRIAKNGKLDREQFITWYKVYDMPAAQE